MAAPLASMTGYARVTGDAMGAAWTWEIKTVNAKGCELRLRVPPGYDAVEAAARPRIAARVHRGTILATLTLARAQTQPAVRLNRDALLALIEALSTVELPKGFGPASLDGLLAVPGIVETVDRTEARGDAPERDRVTEALMAGLDIALDECVAMRAREGGALGFVLRDRLAAIARLVQAAEDAPGRRPDAIRTKLEHRISALLAEVPALDETRLYQEAVLLASKADVREELDRLLLHRAAAADLLEAGGVVGRRLDFLAQELAREAGTLCAKSPDGSLTMIGLDLRTEIEQFREQVQNLE